MGISTVCKCDFCEKEVTKGIHIKPAGPVLLAVTVYDTDLDDKAQLDFCDATCAGSYFTVKDLAAKAELAKI